LFYRCNSTVLLAIALIANLIAGQAHADEKEVSRPRPRVVDDLDLERYAGTWHEIARIPNRFQKDCVSNTTAQYTVLEDGKVEVINRCIRENGGLMETKGIAKQASGDNPARLEVSFVRVLGQQLFWGDYWVIGLGEDYEYAIVGHPDRKYGWILAREPVLGEETLQSIHAQLLQQGYDPEQFEFAETDRTSD